MANLVQVQVWAVKPKGLSLRQAVVVRVEAEHDFVFRNVYPITLQIPKGPFTMMFQMLPDGRHRELPIPSPAPLHGSNYLFPVGHLSFSVPR